MTRNWIARASQHLGLIGANTRRACRHRASVSFERLEGRRLLSGDLTLYTVTDTSDSLADTGSLAYAVAQANANTNPNGSLIEFSATVFIEPQTITLSSTLMLSETDGPETINGTGKSLISINGGGAVQVFQVVKGTTAALKV